MVFLSRFNRRFRFVGPMVLWVLLAGGWVVTGVAAAQPQVESTPLFGPTMQDLTPSPQPSAVTLSLSGQLPDTLQGASAPAPTEVRQVLDEHGQLVAEYRPTLVVSDTTGKTPSDFLTGTGTGFDGVVNLFLFDTGGGALGTCSGSLLVGGNHILTAAHCLTDPPVQVGTIVAQFTTASGITNIAVPTATLAGGWDGTLLNGHDAAVLTLASTAPTDADRYDIFRTADDVGEVATIAGFGQTGVGSSGATSSDGLRRSGFNRVDDTTGAVTAVFGAGFTAPSGSMLTYDFDNGQAANDAFGFYFGLNGLGQGGDEVSIAPGDSGGPSLVDGRVAGIHSFTWRIGGTPNSDVDSTLNSSFGEFATDTRVASYQGFIDSLVLESHAWVSALASDNWGNTGAWSPAGTPFDTWLADVLNPDAFDKEAVVDADSTVYQANLSGTSNAMNVVIRNNATLTAILDTNVGSNGNLVVESGSLDAPSLNIIPDVAGTGQVRLEGGALNAADILIGPAGGGSATLQWNAGSLIADRVEVGAAGTLAVGIGGLGNANGEIFYTADLTVNGGSVDLPAADFSTGDPTRQKILVLDNGGSVNITSNGGSLTAYSLVVGDTTTDSTYTQNGGTTYFVSEVILGRGIGSYGEFVQNGGSLLSNATAGLRTIWVGYGGEGRYVMNDGYIGFNVLQAGEPPRLYAGVLGDGEFEQNGGTVNVEAVELGFATAAGKGTYTLNGGTLNAEELDISADRSIDPINNGAGHFDVNNAAADINLQRGLRFGGHSEYTAVAGTTITLSGAYDTDVEIENTDANDLLGLNHTTLVFDDIIFTATLEAAGRDNFANLLDGFTGNFALDTLELTAEFAGGAEELDLVDNFDNITGLADAVFVKNLVLAAGTSVNLNGVDLYYQTLTGSGSILTANGGTATQVAGGTPVPEPAAALGLLALTALRRNRNRG